MLSYFWKKNFGIFQLGGEMPRRPKANTLLDGPRRNCCVWEEGEKESSTLEKRNGQDKKVATSMQKIGENKIKERMGLKDCRLRSKRQRLIVWTQNIKKRPPSALDSAGQGNRQEINVEQGLHSKRKRSSSLVQWQSK